MSEEAGILSLFALILDEEIIIRDLIGAIQPKFRATTSLSQSQPFRTPCIIHYVENDCCLELQSDNSQPLSSFRHYSTGVTQSRGFSDDVVVSSGRDCDNAVVRPTLDLMHTTRTAGKGC